MGYVYVIQTKDGRVKIGQTIDHKRRFAEIHSKYNASINKSFISDNICNHKEIELILLKRFRENKSITDWVKQDFDSVSKVAKATVLNVGILDVTGCKISERTIIQMKVDKDINRIFNGHAQIKGKSKNEAQEIAMQDWIDKCEKEQREG